MQVKLCMNSATPGVSANVTAYYAAGQCSTQLVYYDLVTPDNYGKVGIYTCESTCVDSNTYVAGGGTYSTTSGSKIFIQCDFCQN